MRIAFLCSSLEPGRDGVGDYTRALARECVRQGHMCALIALHDRHIVTPTERETASDRASLPILRLPATTPWKQRITTASAFISQFNPDWLSLQFVPYGFNDKGIVWNLTPGFRELLADRRLHLMFHELWIGDAVESPIKHRPVGAIQRFFILKMLRELKPEVIHTSNPVYVRMLGRAGVEAGILPLFGSIPIADSNDTTWLFSQLQNIGYRVNGHNRPDFWIVTMFGTLHPEWKPEPLFGMVLAAAKKAGKQVCLVAAGRIGVGGETLWNRISHEYAGRIFFLKLGGQPEEKLSQLFQAADFGIAASPWQLIGKSASAAAMLEHGLPLIVSRDDHQPRINANASPSDDPLLHRVDGMLETKLISGLMKRQPALRIQKVASDLTCHLSTGSRASSVFH